MNNANTQNEELKYSKLLSSLFCSTSIIALSILCLLNNLSIDIYSTLTLLKIVLPASFCFWFIGYIIGRILDSLNKKIINEQIKQEKEPYEIPSMFTIEDNATEDELGTLWKTNLT